MIIGISGDHCDSATVQICVGDDDSKLDPQGEYTRLNVLLFISTIFLFLGLGFPAGFYSWQHWYHVIGAFYSANSHWLKKEDQETWVVIRSCEA